MGAMAQPVEPLVWTSTLCQPFIHTFLRSSVKLSISPYFSLEKGVLPIYCTKGTDMAAHDDIKICSLITMSSDPLIYLVARQCHRAR